MATDDSDDDCVIIADIQAQSCFSLRAGLSAKALETVKKPRTTDTATNRAGESNSTSSQLTSHHAPAVSQRRRAGTGTLQQRSYSESTRLDNVDSFLSAVPSLSSIGEVPSSTLRTPLQRHGSASTVASFSTRGLVERAARDAATVDTSHLRERFIHLQPFSLRPGEYDIILMVDTQEVSNSGIGGGRSLISELLTAGMLPEQWIQKRLSVGDFLWIARERLPPALSTQAPVVAAGRSRRAIPKPPEPRELVLDYIIERKRLDDLSQSICDGRFREQKARLSECGLRRPIYLIEKYAVQLNHGVSESNLRQAIIDTQIIDNFYIKETPNITGTAQYLYLMTQTLKQLYADKTLHATYLHDQLVRINNDEELNEDDQEIQLITYEEFSAASRKQRNWTIKELWLRHLVQIKGMSWEKAVAIILQYPTPSRLFRAYEACTSEREKQDLLATLKFGLQQRNVGKAISNVVYRIYNTRELLPATATADHDT